MVDFRKYSCFPSILLAIEGPWLCILGAIYHTTAMIEPLKDYIFCADRPIDLGTRVPFFARLFTALSNAYRILQNYYRNLESEIKTRRITIDSSLFPYRVTYPSHNGIIAIT